MEDTNLYEAIAKALDKFKDATEPVISSAVTEVINSTWFGKVINWNSVKGEEDEKVEGAIGKSPTKGKPDVVVRQPMKEGETPLVQLIFEFSVDNNGGEKKLGQAADYASLIKDKHETVMLFTFNLHRRYIKESSGGIAMKCKITQEAFLYLHSEGEFERKVAFLWREIYQ